jgi:competence protein ComEA
VSGAVNFPGVYCLSAGSNINDALIKAGEINKDLFAYKYVAQKINLSKQLEDQQKIYIPFQDDIDCTEKPLDTKFDSITDTQNQKVYLDNSGTKLCVSLNNASIEELDTLDGIGIATAQKIIDSRPYTSIEDLLNVKGIGEATFDKLKARICL